MMKRTRRNLTLAVLLFVAVACAPEKKYKILSTFFDGVPPPKARGAEAPAAEGASPEPPAAGPPTLPGTMTPGTASELESQLRELQKVPRPPIESLRTWQEVLGLLPRDTAGGADWVEAVKRGVIRPRLLLDPGKAPRPPFTLDTLVPGIDAQDRPPFDLDIEMTPRPDPFFAVRFPHASHTLWLNCGSCHPGVVAKRAPMEKILRGESCGTCHGVVAFDPATGGCPRCHANLVPPARETVDVELRRAETEPVPATDGILERGREVYAGKCAMCHGESGDGKGALADLVDPRPRDFTAGKYKFRSTPFTSIPTDVDLFRVVTLGINGTSMPAWSKLSYEDRWALVHFIKRFSGRFSKERPAELVPVGPIPPRTQELLEQGRTMYTEAGCNSCHGNEGRGDGESAPDLKNDWGERLGPFDFAGGSPPKRGEAPQDYYRTIMTGLTGTPMPDFGEIFEPQQAWAVVYHLLSLKKEGGGASFGIKGEIRFQREAPPGELPAASFPHWFHRIRFKCAACHPSITIMKAGANQITMAAMSQGRFCGACHNGKVAWEIGFPTCVRCHADR